MHVQPPNEGGAESGSRRGDLKPGLVHASIAVGLAVLIAGVALTARQPPPPTVAELAPNAAQRIRDVQSQQGSELGASGGEEDVSRATPLPSGPTPNPSTAPRKLKCFGDPPRQTEDRQSPLCKSLAEKEGNGGATWRGVTADEIVVAVPSLGSYEDENVLRAMASHFSDRYQFYGRRLRLETFGGNAPFGPADPASMRADAKRVADEKRAFASLNYFDREGAEHVYYEALAAEGVVSVMYRQAARATESWLRSRGPHLWNVQPGVDTVLRNLGAMACDVLRGRPARHAGPALRDVTRKFGVVYTVASDGTKPDVAPLTNTLRSCGAPYAGPVESRPSNDPARGQTLMLNLAQEDITSVVCVCHLGETRSTLMPGASAQAYQPEWIVSSYVDQDLDNSWSSAPPDQAAHVFGLSFRNKLLPMQEMPFFAAAKEGNAKLDPTTGMYYPHMARYATMLLLASGIQWAGPNLTPQTFAAALERLTSQPRSGFPNPGAGDGPQYQAAVGFDGGRHSMTADAAMIWYDPSRRSVVQPDTTGAYCYVDRGTRYGLGSWNKAADAFFAGDCR